VKIFIFQPTVGLTLTNLLHTVVVNHIEVRMGGQEVTIEDTGMYSNCLYLCSGGWS